MPSTDTRSTEYRTPEELAELAEEIRTESHAVIADHLSVSRSAVSHALGDQHRQHVQLLRRILALYGVEVEEKPRYRVERPH